MVQPAPPTVAKPSKPAQLAPAPADGRDAPDVNNVVPVPAPRPALPQGPCTRPASQDERLRLQKASARLASAAALMTMLRADRLPAIARQEPAGLAPCAAPAAVRTSAALAPEPATTLAAARVGG